MKRFMLLAVAALATIPAHAETDWPAQFAGLDGVAVTCISSYEADRARRICDEMSTHVLARAEKAGAKAVATGYFKEGAETPARPDAFARPLDITIFIRGAANPDGLFVATRASVAYEGAVEAGGAGPGRSGELVLYERSTLGTGPLSRLTPAIISAAKDRLEPFMVRLEENWPR